MSYYDLNNYIEAKTSKLKTEYRETKHYVHGIYRQYISANGDLSNETIIIKYAEAKENYSFEKYQQIADWLFFGLTLFPQQFNTCSKDYYETIGKISYYRCYKMMNRQWPCFEELADKFEDFVKDIKNEI